MKPKTTKKVASYFDESALIILPISFDHSPSEVEFKQIVELDSGVPSVLVITPKEPEPGKPKSAAIWLAFPVNDRLEHLFYVAFPSTKDNKKCWQVGMSNKGTEDEKLTVLEYSPDTMANNPFEALKEVPVKVISMQELFIDKCPQVEKMLEKVESSNDLVALHAVQQKLEVIWNATGGSPCKRCNRPEGCKLQIITK